MIQSQLFFNKCFDKNKLKGLISWSLRNYGEAVTLDLVEKLKTVGFFWATQAGISLSIDDLKIPKEKSALLLDAENLSKLASDQFSSGNLTTVERLQQLIDAWHRTSETLKQEVISNFRKTDPLNPVYMMAFSGARGNISQVRQLVGMRGLMADPQGRIIDFPIRSNFREGLTLTEYVISCYGARKGIVDTALRTATSGYLTRRLVDVAQHIVVANYDCETEQGIPLAGLKQGTKIILPLSDRILGRVLAENLDGIAGRNTCISQYLASKISKTRESILVRSPLLCKSKNGVCQLCYGWSLAHNELVSIGEAVGIIAAQSIGEPGTQLTMRTFHTGGVFSGEIIDQVQAPKSGTVKFSKPLKGTLVRTSYGKIGFLSREAGILTITSFIQGEKDEEISFPLQSILFVRQGQTVSKNEILLEYASSATDQDQGIQATQLVTAPQKGEVFFEDVIVLKDELNTETQAYQLGSFWLLTSHLHSNSENLRGSFRYIKGDLVTANSSLQSSQLVNQTTTFSYLEQKEKPLLPTISYNPELPRFYSKISDLGITMLQYKFGNYLGFSYLSKKVNKFLSSDKHAFLKFFDEALLTLPNFSSTLNKNVGSFHKNEPKLYFLFSNLNFWPYSQKFKTYNFSQSYKKKQFTGFVSETNSLKSGPFQKVEKIQKKLGHYTFKKVSGQNSSVIFTKPDFYVTSEHIPLKLFSTVFSDWKISSSNSALLCEKRFLYKIEETKQGYYLRQSLFKPIVSQIPSYFLNYLFSRQEENFSRGLENLTRTTLRNQLKLIKLFQKTTCLTFLFPNVTTFSYSDQSKNKQTIDSSLLLNNTFNFEFESFSVTSGSSYFIVQLSTNLLFDNLRWLIDPTTFQTLGLYGESEIILPTKRKNYLTKSTPLHFLDWKLAKRKLVKNQIILGQIDKKTPDTIEIFKLLTKNNVETMLSINKRDLFAVDTKETPCNTVLGTLVRPGKEILPNFTILQSGQILSINKNALVIRKALPILFSSKANFHVFHGDFIEKGLPLITLTYKRLTTGDIVQGIPRIEQLFEARQTTTVLHEQLHELFETYKTRMRLDLAARKSFQKIQRILIDSIQRVYQSQGVTISDKHLEIIVRQMTSTVRILKGGRTRLLRGELKSIDWIEKINLGIDIQKAEYEPILLGITKASLETESFISAASFQETTRTLSRAAIEGRTDFLRGLKENVILGHRVPAGTGAPLISYLTKFSTDSEIVDDLSSELSFLLKE